jgi:hypothetical protein
MNHRGHRDAERRELRVFLENVYFLLVMWEIISDEVG